MDVKRRIVNVFLVFIKLIVVFGVNFINRIRRVLVNKILVYLY